MSLIFMLVPSDLGVVLVVFVIESELLSRRLLSSLMLVPSALDVVLVVFAIESELLSRRLLSSLMLVPSALDIVLAVFAIGILPLSLRILTGIVLIPSFRDIVMVVSARFRYRYTTCLQYSYYSRSTKKATRPHFRSHHGETHPISYTVCREVRDL